MDQPDIIAFYENQCCICLKPFEQKRGCSKRLTCSGGCRQRLHRLRHPRSKQSATPGTTNANDESRCRVCGAGFQQARTGRRRQTCSDACRKRWFRQQNPHCVVCKQAFRRAARQPGKIYCGVKCRDAMVSRRRWQRELERRKQEQGGYRPTWIPTSGSAYAVEELPAQAKKRLADPPEWWLDKLHEWRKLAAQQRSARDRGFINAAARLDGPGQRQGEPDWGPLIQEAIDKLASAGITLDGRGDMAWADVEGLWLEYERRMRHKA